MALWVEQFNRRMTYLESGTFSEVAQMDAIAISHRLKEALEKEMTPTGLDHCAKLCSDLMTKIMEMQG